jgi:glycerol kinase
MKSYILALDQGTTSSRAILFDRQGQWVSMAQEEFTQYYPQPGWVEHDAEELWSTQLSVARRVMEQAGVRASEIAAVGITNQRETTLLWDRYTGQPLGKAIVWQDRRTAEHCDQLKSAGWETYVRSNTGLVIDAYFSATKLAWMLDHLPEARRRAEAGDLCFGTVDSWLIYRLTDGKVHATDYSNASRTMLYNIVRLEWDEPLLSALRIPRSVLPEVMPSNAYFGELAPEWLGEAIPVTGVAGDQQAALFGQACLQAGMAKNTYGTGCFMLMNTGDTPVLSSAGLITTIAWGLNHKIQYALEGSVFIAGAAIQWLRDGLRIIDESPDSEFFSMKVADTNGVYVVPAFAGLGAPYWDMYARGAIFGLTRGVNKSHLIRATLESLAYQTRDVLAAMESDAGQPIHCLRVDGGASANNLLMQFQADILNTAVERPRIIETTALGAAYLAGLAAGFWTVEDLADKWACDAHFSPQMEAARREQLYKGWQKAVERTMRWVED